MENSFIPNIGVSIKVNNLKLVMTALMFMTNCRLVLKTVLRELVQNL